MSRQLINEYRGELDRLKSISGSRRESVLREAFKDLLKRWGKSNDLQFIAEYDLITPKGNRIALDGALLHSLRVPFGYWEAKDEDDDLAKEIEAKFRSGYPKDNTIFTDDATSILYQDGHEAGSAPMDDTEALFVLLTHFFAHERQEVADFRKAVKQFATDLPAVLAALRDIIAEKRAASSAFAKAETDFLAHARDAINPAVNEDDVQEMLIQHILTEDIFAKVFENPDFHRQNNVAAALYALEEKLFGYGEKQRLLKALGPYYSGIASTAAVIESHSEKQGFLKGLYENFYKVYNPLAADRLGVVYTPGEIVRFMIRSADWLCHEHFGKHLEDKGVEILDPATGTGTFIVELLEHFRGNREKLAHKYKEELHANEVAILPYYVANLNIEATYAAITGQFAEYPNLCFVDTLDNVAALGIYAGHQGDMFGSVSDENLGRIKRQNERKISVIIGNPPYNANQQNENDNNQNRTYARIDSRIKQTYIKASTAQKTKLYDMYARFYRWATDRLGKEGIVAFVTNNSFLEARTFDGFRKKVAEDFSEAWVINLKGNARNSGERRKREGGNVFEDKIKVGIAIAFFVRRKTSTPFRIHYLAVQDFAREDDKRQFVDQTRLDHSLFTTILPKADGTWLGQNESAEWDAMLPIASNASKRAIDRRKHDAIFQLYTLGIVTNRDEWVYDFSAKEVRRRALKQAKIYDSAIADPRPFEKSDDAEKRFSPDIKWTRLLKASARRRRLLGDVASQVRKSAYRPFVSKWVLFNTLLNEFQYQTPSVWPDATTTNSSIALVSEERAQFGTLAFEDLPNKDMFMPSASQVLPRHRYTKSGERVDNITDWSVAQFRAHYGEAFPGEKDAIFAYVYAVLHDPFYREKYALNLKREFPRIPFYPDFAQWVAWGEALLKLHIDYEKQKPFKLTRNDTPAPKRAADTHPKPKLKSITDTGTIVVDEDTQLSGIPPEAWAYRLGNRSAIDWVLDQHKEKTPRDPTIRAKFNTYRFADYKEEMIKLLAKVVTVSMETVKITDAMRDLKRDTGEGN
ncbi:MAG: N-6 DNA methylase [Sphingomonas sp.]|uniref:type ISP restriction/modification enzyme n=1 Tax=Sphingomonas sp. TaxID=28214 RepID=UPI00178FF3D3|nr:type ISP restriction/modification enzyme [Sphingomonas sp.]MBA3666897.1 N-6 DNA methylase [Sphingomonas sp.]